MRLTRISLDWAGAGETADSTGGGGTVTWASSDSSGRGALCGRFGGFTSIILNQGPFNQLTHSFIYAFPPTCQKRLEWVNNCKLMTQLRPRTFHAKFR